MLVVGDSVPRHDLSGTAIGLPISWGGFGGQCRHIWHIWSVWDRQPPQKWSPSQTNDQVESSVEREVSRGDAEQHQQHPATVTAYIGTVLTAPHGTKRYITSYSITNIRHS